MSDGIKKFEELARTDEVFQQKLQDALASYTGEQTEEAVFANVLSPFAAEYGISATYDEFKEYISNQNNMELSRDDLSQIAGGKVSGGGLVIQRCEIFGFGAGAGGGSGAGGACVGIGFGKGVTGCLTAGVSGTLDL